LTQTVALGLVGGVGFCAAGFGGVAGFGVVAEAEETGLPAALEDAPALGLLEVDFELSD
jgi:hypothetical protein